MKIDKTEVNSLKSDRVFGALTFASNSNRGSPQRRRWRWHTRVSSWRYVNWRGLPTGRVRRVMRSDRLRTQAVNTDMFWNGYPHELG